ncbi:hypothetical protein SELMODRAFT_441996 [Selaginella moellendorffii]|uniref:Uncharacterized protein n=1 Tax=Selaginella moellendorffii TaxID=88036 RepID=D8RPK1_SELML|nr:hypothetical protein SELMODRAFT_441996 [Selaginella moellendorffii]
MASSSSNSGSGSSSSPNSGYVLTMIENQTDRTLLLKEGRGIWRQEMRYQIEPWSTAVIRLELDDASRHNAALVMVYGEEEEEEIPDRHHDHHRYHHYLNMINLETSPVYVPIDQLLCHKRIVVCWKKGRYLWTDFYWNKSISLVSMYDPEEISLWMPSIAIKKIKALMICNKEKVVEKCDTPVDLSIVG